MRELKEATIEKTIKRLKANQYFNDYFKSFQVAAQRKESVLAEEFVPFRKTIKSYNF